MCHENYLRKIWFFRAIRHSYKILISKKTTLPTAARCLENWPIWLVNNFSQKKPRHSRQLGAVKISWEKYVFFNAIRQSYKTLVNTKKTTALTAVRCRESWPNRLVHNFRQRIHGTHGSCLPWKLSLKKYAFSIQYGKIIRLQSAKKTSALMAAMCRENWPTWVVNNFSQKIHGTHGSWVLWK